MILYGFPTPVWVTHKNTTSFLLMNGPLLRSPYAIDLCTFIHSSSAIFHHIHVSCPDANSFTQQKLRAELGILLPISGWMDPRLGAWVCYLAFLEKHHHPVGGIWGAAFFFWQCCICQGLGHNQTCLFVVAHGSVMPLVVYSMAMDMCLLGARLCW